MVMAMGIKGSASVKVAFISFVSSLILVRGRTTYIYKKYTPKKLETPPISPPIKVMLLRLNPSDGSAITL